MRIVSCFFSFFFLYYIKNVQNLPFFLSWFFFVTERSFFSHFLCNPNHRLIWALPPESMTSGSKHRIRLADFVIFKNFGFIYNFLSPRFHFLAITAQCWQNSPLSFKLSTSISKKRKKVAWNVNLSPFHHIISRKNAKFRFLCGKMLTDFLYSIKNGNIRSSVALSSAAAAASSPCSTRAIWVLMTSLTALHVAMAVGTDNENDHTQHTSKESKTKINPEQGLCKPGLHW